VKDADTFFGVELPGLVEWTFGPDDAARVRRPVLSVVGTKTGQLWVEVAELLRGSLPYIEERRIDDVGHLLHLEAPTPVAEAIAAFLTANPIDRPARS
jgi:3-oxoadipate enol-lactonase